MAKLTDKTELTTPADDDLLHIVDISDTTGSPQGTSKKIQVSNLTAKSSIYISSTTNAEKTRTNDNVNWLDLDGATEEQATVSSDLSSDDLGAITNDGATRDFFIDASLTGYKNSTARQFQFQILIDGVPADSVDNVEQLGSAVPEIMGIFTKVSVPATGVVTLGSFQVNSASLLYTKLSIKMVEA